MGSLAGDAGVGMREGSVETGRLWRVILLLLWIGCTAYVWSMLDHGWIPHDEGALAHAAERVTAGELPHRDFADVYTGGLAMANAVALSVRDDLMAPRFLLFLVFVAWVPVFYWLARQFVPQAASAATTVLAVALGLPVYPAAVPSWYNLYFATFGLAAILAWMSTGRRGWLLLAGVVGALSVLIKISGLYFVAAAVIVVAVFDPSDETPEPGRTFPVIVSIGAFLLALAVTSLVGGRFGTSGLVQIALPIGLVLTAIAAIEWLPYRSGSVTRLYCAFRRLAVCAVGFAVPILLFLLPYASSGSVRQVIDGVFILPARRFEFASMAPPGLGVSFFLPPLLVLLAVGQAAEKRIQPIIVGLSIPVLLILFWASGSPLGYLFSWFPLYYLLSISVLVGGAVLLSRIVRQMGRAPGSRAMAPGESLISVKATAVFLTAAMAALIQVPFAAPIYALYVAPLGLLAALGVLALLNRTRSPGIVTVSAYLVLFLVIRVHPGSIMDLGRQPGVRTFTESLDLERGGIQVTASEKAEYERAVALLQEHASGGYALAAPDCPELYFLAGLSNPTRNLFEFFAESPGGDDRLLALIREKGIRVIAINNYPGFSSRFSGSLLDELARRFPESEEVGRFTVRWAS